MPEGVRADRFLAEAEQAAAAEPMPETPLDVIEDSVTSITEGQDAKLERRRQRRKSRPHGRAR
jgi:hypothetical protein